MQTTASLRKLTVAGLVLLGCGSLANAQITFKASQTDGLTLGSGNNVASWSDVGTTYTLTPSGTAPTFTAGTAGLLNGQGFVSFNNSPLTEAGQILSPMVGATESAAFIVLRTTHQSKTILSWRQDGLPAGNWTSLYQASENGGSIFYVQGNAQGPTGGDLVSAPAPAWDTGFHVLSLIRNGSAGQIRFDGAPLATTGAFEGPIATGATGLLAIGGLPAAGDAWAGDIAEISVYNAVPTDISAVEASLGQSYGLSVVPEPSEYAMIFGLACVGGALALRYRRQTSMAR